MNITTKRRVIGGLVLAAILAIFLPFLFHEAKPTTQLSLSGKVPEAPKAPQITLKLPSEKTIAAQQSMQTQITGNKITAVQVTPSHASTVQTVSAAVQTATAKTAVDTEVTPQRLITEPKLQAKPADKSKAQPHSSAPAPKRKSPPAVVKHVPVLHAPQAWVVQLASFKSMQNAERLISRLRKKGFNAYTRKSNAATGVRLVRVYVGPEIQRGRAKKIQKLLKSEFKLNGIVAKYHV